ncbi:hypothetical protein K450DRAFT_235185 [Umbelopsis ramanniana AG]|uniref:Mediator of RNA polymerase II transcription subunit 21 n=1 Tax=Umbelopsis ramanniana AG TaxID=1314678 RepID=A0AAD5EBL1_UMBRA|nr:uncharacterized protein K450DRAFT_235185 [Umbelopsis ramanniana AG]KAI8580911.1 hypothetical protein K450DRAFT_235185 [Umbelopsis ramanniana AG]
MDRLTQLQDAVDAMARMFTNSIYYVHEKSAMAALSDNIPVIHPKVQADPPDIFQQNMKELVSDIVKKGQEIDRLIEALPGISRTEEEQIEQLSLLEEENAKANQEYEKAVADTESLMAEITQALRRITDEQSKQIYEKSN